MSALTLAGADDDSLRFSKDWEDLVVGIESIVMLLEQKFLIPIVHPNLGDDSPSSNNFLLFGPPGCGKSFIARVVAKKISANFLSVSTSDILGEDPAAARTKMRAVFDVARKHSPIVVLFDDCEDIFGERDISSKHDGAINEFSCQLQGADDTLNNQGVYIFLTTSLPWMLDSAKLLWRIRNRIHVKLPNMAARINVFKYYLENHKELRHSLLDVEFAIVAEKTKGHSHRDLKELVDHIFEQLQHTTVSATHFHKRFQTGNEPGCSFSEAYYTPVLDGEDENGALEMSFSSIPSGQVRLPKVTLKTVVDCIRPKVVSSFENEVTQQNARAILSDKESPVMKKYIAYEKFCGATSTGDENSE